MKDKKSGWKEEFRQLVFCWSFWAMVTFATYGLLKLFDDQGINQKVIYLVFGIPVLIYLWESIRLILWIISWVMMNIWKRKESSEKQRWEGYLEQLSRKGWY